MVKSLGKLADHLDSCLDREARALFRHEMVEPPPIAAIPEDDRRTGLMLIAELLRLDDPLVRDSLQGQVLAAGGPPCGVPFCLRGMQLRQVDADPTDLVARQRGVLREVVLPGRPSIESPRSQLEGADLPVLVQALDAYLLQQLFQLPGQCGVYAAAGAARVLAK